MLSGLGRLFMEPTSLCQMEMHLHGKGSSFQVMNRERLLSGSSGYDSGLSGSQGSPKSTETEPEDVESLKKQLEELTSKKKNGKLTCDEFQKLIDLKYKTDPEYRKRSNEVDREELSQGNRKLENKPPTKPNYQPAPDLEKLNVGSILFPKHTKLQSAGLLDYFHSVHSNSTITFCIQ